jgi:FecR protein
MRNLRRFAFMHFFLALFVSAAALSAFADPPSRAVRLEYISGSVSMQPGGVNDWVAAVVNRPLTSSDRVWTDKAARAELHLGSAGLRMNDETSLTLTNVSDDIVQVELDQGTLNLHIRHLFGGETYEIDTPNQAFTILKAGDYRFDVDPNADTTSVTVWRGEGEANGEGPGVKLRSGQQASFTGGTSLQHQMASAPGFDGFDDWCRVRDDREDHAKSYQYVSADVVGADELDQYGTWRTVGTYGPVWVPAVAPGWAPYHYGHWVWVEPWGWTWVDDAPWGYAPCHYGRWVNTGGFWAWAPGPMVVARPVYAPALVAWVGGPHFGVGLSFGGGGGVGWFALGWGEPYVPSYQVSREYFQQVNVSNTRITNITNVTNNYYVANNNTTIVNTNIQNIHYANQTVNGAVTAVPTRAMTNSESVSRAAVMVPASEVRAGAFATAAPVAPARTSVLGVNAAAHAPIPPAQIGARPVVSHMAPPPKPVPFEAKQEALARNPGRPLDKQAEADLRTNVTRTSPAAMNRTTAPTGTPAAPTVANQPARPNTPAVSAAPRPGAPAAASEPARPGVPSPAASRPVVENPAPHPAAGNTQPEPAMPGRSVPHPPTALIQPVSATGVSASGISPASGHTVPRPPQPGSSNSGYSNPEAERPNTSNASARPGTPSNPTIPPSMRTPMPTSAAMGANTPSSPSVPPSMRTPMPPSAATSTSATSSPRPPVSNAPRATTSSRPPQTVQQSVPRSSGPSEPGSRPSSSHASAPSHAQHGEPSHSQSKPEHKSENK